MPWIAAAIMVGGSVVGHALSKGDRAASRSAKDRQADAAEDQVQLGRDTLDWSKEQYGKWEDRFDPIFGDMMDTLEDDLEPNYAQIAGDVKSGFQSARGQERRSLQRYGVRPQDGATARSEREYGIREAAAHVGTRSVARESKRGLKFSRLADVTGMGYGIQPSMTNSVNSAASNAGRAFTNMSNVAGNLSTQYSNQANQTAYGVGNTLGSMDWAGMWNSTKGWMNQRNNAGGNDPSYGMYAKPSGQQGPTAPSDIRLKSNVKHVGEVMGVRVYTWEWNEIAIERGLGSNPTFGVIAQWIPQEYVTEVDGYLTVDYNSLFGEK
jgi:hypothetical protein